MDDALWVSATPALAAVAARIGRGPLALDVEADSLHHYPERVCLIQLSFGGRDVLVDPLAGVDLRPLGPRLEDPTLRKIVHAGDYDLRVLHRDFGFVVRGLSDTLLAARLAGSRTLGLAGLVEEHLGVRLDKRHQRADWSRRPLTPEMREYARSDTRYLEPLAERLEARLRELGRMAWYEEECRALEDVRWTREPGDPDAFRRVKGAAQLAPRELAVLRELWQLRDAVALDLGRPPGLTLRDERLVELARKRPPEAEIASLAGLPPPLRGTAGAARITAALARGMALGESELPPVRGGPPRRDPAFDGRVARLRSRRDELAKTLALDPALIAPRALLEELQHRIDRGDDPTQAPGLRAWQRDLLRPWLGG